MLKVTRSARETMAFGTNFAKGLCGGEVVLLIGDLGAGKTTFVKGVAAAFGIKRTVNSPTFVIMKVYEVGRGGEGQRAKGKGQKKDKSQKPKLKNLIHIDTYRGLSIADLENIGALEYFGRNDTICFVEWGAGLEDYLRARRLAWQKLEIKSIDENTREFIF